MARIPTPAEIDAQLTAWGHGSGPFDTKTRAKAAKAIQLGQKLEVAERADEAVSVSFAARLEQIAADLRRHNFSATGAEEIAAAIAPAVYRESRDKEPTA
ncbi:hypothetical protein SEA_WIDOW_13 [Gordonia phage Widow]|nr:hypothetical protein SEA_WIDOW_13 [Gordonia phage Widow]